MVLTHPSVRRSRVYGTLSRGFLYPVAGLLMELGKDGFVRALRTALPADGMVLAERVQAAIDEPGDLETEYNMLFGGQAVSCPLYETEYTGAHVWMQTQQMADIAGFYRAFGVDLPGERPDGLAAELEFMALLCMKEAVAEADSNPEAAALCADAQTKFLQEHLGRWLPKLQERLAAQKRSGYYVELVGLTAWFVEREVSLCKA